MSKRAAWVAGLAMWVTLAACGGAVDGPASPEEEGGDAGGAETLACKDVGAVCVGEQEARCCEGLVCGPTSDGGAPFVCGPRER